MHVITDDAVKARFLKGILLSWIPFLWFMVPMIVSAVRVVSVQRATGMGAVAGGMSESLVTFGLAAIVATQVGAILLLTRTFDRGHAFRGILSAISIFCSLFLLALIVAIMWLLIRMPR